jgi:hypothetical protein
LEHDKSFNPYPLGHSPLDDDFWRTRTPREARTRLVEALRFELLGPATAEEELRESPLTRYATGMLAPFGTGVADDEQDEELTGGGDDEEAGAVEMGAPMSQAVTPSSIGLSFLLSHGSTSLTVTAEWGDYAGKEVRDEDLEGEENKEHRDDLQAKGGAKKKKRTRLRLRWLRTPRGGEELAIELKPDAGLQQVDVIQGDNVTVEHLTRTLGDRLAVSIFLVNRRGRGDRARPSADRWLFQPQLTVRGSSAGPIFLPRELEPALAHSDRDRESNRLLFRDRREFAIGHGCAAEWSEAAESSRAVEVRTELVPKYELPRVDPREFGGRGLDMDVLADAGSGEDLQGLLNPLLDEYESWIARKQDEVSLLSPDDLQPVANTHLTDCRDALKRMRRGIECIVQDVDAFEAFRFANHAMLLQRSHTAWAKERRRGLEASNSGPNIAGRWRPFQLAFVLLNLPGLIDIDSEDRLIGDLLWFPTGGGKTEAYLGLAAFTVALRRRRSVAGMRTDAGLAVLMRYTLRLLTIQQFQRAAALLCACEVLRMKDPVKWGDYRFSIGLWLGMQGTPNSHDDSRRALIRIQKDPSEEGANPCVLESCPWCGELLTPDDYWADGEAFRTRVACPRSECPFSTSNCSSGLPVVVVDEEIYRECPSLLIATVDKFAQMPWKGDVQSLFGFVDRECDRCGFLTPATSHTSSHRSMGTKGTTGLVRATERLAPPDLIIQDELHLISGPLGTLVGLYEAAVDFLSSRFSKGRAVGPKVVASTATVRRAFEQVQAVFHRDLRVFPPPGLEPDDSFFAVEQEAGEEAPGRLYVGVCAPGKSMKTAYVRVAASLLSSGGGLRWDASLAEPYMTVVSYFNSLRELGGAIRLMDDDIPARLDQLRTAGLSPRNRPVYVELTSRIRQEAIPNLLRGLERRHDTPRSEEDPLPFDVVLASNMISVGVDIDRLGLMTVTGQPKTTAEYIQATSRVGRQPWGPGLVVTIYNWSRPRDLSHYERFRHYHATLYRSVEAVSATPFSSRALDRGLRGTYVAMVRLGSETWSLEEAAGRFDPADRRVASVVKALRERAAVVADGNTAEALARSLKGLGDEWSGYGKGSLRYGWRSPNPDLTPNEDVLLRVAERSSVGHWPAPQSLREVEDTSPVRLLGIDVK